MRAFLKNVSYLYYLRFNFNLFLSLQGQGILKTPQLKAGKANCCLKMLFFLFHQYLL